MTGLFVKICGLSTGEAVAAAVEAGADALGFVFATSPRQVDPERAARLLEAVPAGIERIAVFRQVRAELLDAVAALGFDTVQALQPTPPEGLRCGYLPAFCDGPELLDALAPFPGRVVLDAVGGGGTGQRADWARAARAAPGRRLILAGGLCAANLEAAIRTVRPWGVDVSSGVERARGVKDPARIHAFIQTARAAARRLAEEHPEEETS